MVTDFLLDENDQITGVADEWDSFAAQNDGEMACRERVLGQSLWSFVSDPETRAYLERIFAACRAYGRAFSNQYRCDCPGKKRFYLMDVTPDYSGNLLVRHRPLTETPIPERINEGGIGPEVRTQRCSVCCSYLVGQDWLDIPAQTADQIAPDLTFTVCNSCNRIAQRKLDAMRPDPAGFLQHKAISH
jgi:hypothetical protein